MSAMTASRGSTSRDTPSTETSGDSVGGAQARTIGSLRHHFDLSASEQGLVHRERRFHEVLRTELDVSEAFRVSVDFVA